MKKLLNLILLLIFCSQIQAHKPVLNENSSYPSDAPYEIEDTEISKAIYSTLSGDPHYYRIQSEEDFDFYSGILAAKIGDCPLESKFSFAVLDSDFHLIYLADGENFKWTPGMKSSVSSGTGMVQKSVKTLPQIKFSKLGLIISRFLITPTQANIY